MAKALTERPRGDTPGAPHLTRFLHRGLLAL